MQSFAAGPRAADTPPEPEVPVRGPALECLVGEVDMDRLDDLDPLLEEPDLDPFVPVLGPNIGVPEPDLVIPGPGPREPVSERGRPELAVGERGVHIILTTELSLCNQIVVNIWHRNGLFL